MAMPMSTMPSVDYLTPTTTPLYPIASGSNINAANSSDLIPSQDVGGDIPTFRAKMDEWPFGDATVTPVSQIGRPGSDGSSYLSLERFSAAAIVGQERASQHHALFETACDPTLSFQSSKAFSKRRSFPSLKKQVASQSGNAPKLTSSVYPFVPIAPSPPISGIYNHSNSHLGMSVSPTLSQPLPLRRSSLLAPSPPLKDAMPVRADGHSVLHTKIGSFPFDNGLGSQATSLTATSPGLTTTPTSHFSDMNDTCMIPADNCFDDPLSLLHFLTQIDLSQFLKREAPQGLGITKRPPMHHSSCSSALDAIPAVEAFSRIERDFMDAVRRKSHHYHDNPEWQLSHEKTASSSPRRVTLPVTPKTKRTNLSSLAVPLSPTLPSSPKTPLTPRIPYKGRFGSHPVCGACKTDKTPYWRDSWSSLFILCNACGLRYAKFKRYCNTCHYVPRKEDKGATCCPHCQSSWSYKS